MRSEIILGRKVVFLFVFILLLISTNIIAAEDNFIQETELITEELKRHKDFVDNNYQDGDFKLVYNDILADLYVDKNDLPGVGRALEDLQKDIERVTNFSPDLKKSTDELSENVVIAGTIGNSQIIDELIESDRLNVSEIEGKWESYIIQVVSDPIPGVDKALIIVGSDRRGAIYGIYELSRQIGVSPWYWWADVTPEHQDNLLVRDGIYKQGEPSVKYRGIFLNNEAPSLAKYTNRFLGGFGHSFYENVFELILRLRGNYLWPAMWSPKSFFRDDILNPMLADQYGIVIGTSHHEPLMRSWGEWSRYGEGDWNFSTNKDNLIKFWEDGIERTKNLDKIVTIGMRGDGDEPMMDKSVAMEEQVEIMEDIISAQREILAKHIDSDLSNVPQVWALYKEVQDFYEHGMEVPDDVTILLTNDNFGNVRMLPKEEERDHPGGYGMYYHFDYVGGPRSYRWVTSTPNPKIWEQMNMAYEHGVDNIWIVNVGDLKPHESAIDFFLEMAYDTEKWNRKTISDYTVQWAEREFDKEYAEDIAEIVDKYKKFNGRRKAEIIEPETYSLTNYKEAEKVLAEFEEIVIKAEEIYDKIAEDKRDAFFQLVLYPARASKNVLKTNVYAGFNNLYAEQGRAIANHYADLTEETFDELNQDTDYYNTDLADNKWRGIMSNAHIGQTGWESPEKNIMPTVKRLSVDSGSEMGVAIEGSKDVWIEDGSIIDDLPTFNVFNKENHYIDIFNIKSDPYQIELTASEPWIELSEEGNLKIDKQSRIWIDIDWEQVPVGEDINAELSITGTDKNITVNISVDNPDKSFLAELEDMTFIESNGYISIEAEHYTNNVEVDGVSWKKIDNYGRTLSSMAIFPTTSPSVTPGENAPYLEYQVYINNPGEISVTTYKAPSNNTFLDRGLKYGIAFNDQKPQIIDSFPKENEAFYSSALWSQGVMENIRKNTSRHQIDEAGLHTLRFWMVDPGVVLQKIVIDTGGVKPSYLGPPESYFKGKDE